MSSESRLYFNELGVLRPPERLPVLGALGSGAPVAQFASAAIGASRLELNVRDELVRTLELPPNRQEVVGALNGIIGDVQERSQKPLLIITDGLDKVHPDRARLLFADSILLTEPACALVYAAPIEFYHRLSAGQVVSRFDEYRVLATPPVHKRPLTGEHWQAEREPAEDGMQVMRQVAAKRLAGHGQVTSDIITSETLDLLTTMSGGVMRELVRYVRDAARTAQLYGRMQIDLTIAQEVVNQQQQEMTARLNVDHRAALRRVLQQGTLSGGQHEKTEDELLRSLYLLSYQDHRHAWFDVHPNVLALL